MGSACPHLPPLPWGKATTGQHAPHEHATATLIYQHRTGQIGHTGWAMWVAKAAWCVVHPRPKIEPLSRSHSALAYTPGPTPAWMAVAGFIASGMRRARCSIREATWRGARAQGCGHLSPLNHQKPRSVPKPRSQPIEPATLIGLVVCV